ncbi:MAG: hypothetical protein R3D01_02700 [Hyphomicrobiales bacterium]
MFNIGAQPVNMSLQAYDNVITPRRRTRLATALPGAVAVPDRRMSARIEESPMKTIALFVAAVGLFASISYASAQDIDHEVLPMPTRRSKARSG